MHLIVVRATNIFHYSSRKLFFKIFFVVREVRKQQQKMPFSSELKQVKTYKKKNMPITIRVSAAKIGFYQFYFGIFKLSDIFSVFKNSLQSNFSLYKYGTKHR